MAGHGCRAALLAALCALFLALGTQGAFAVPEVGDAPSLPQSDQQVGPAGELTSIEGTIADDRDVDVYRICLTGGGSFSASTVDRAGFDTQLFLFNSAGVGVYANDDAGATLRSTLPANYKPVVSDPPLPDTQTAGVYYLAVTPYNLDPANNGSALFPDRTATTGPRHLQPVTQWSGTSNQFDNDPATPKPKEGPYGITLTGTISCTPPDETAPAIDIRAPLDGAEYTRGQVVEADYECTDEPGGSGVADCTGTVADGQPIDTTTLGPKTFTVDTRDNKGNARTLTHTYTVVDDTKPTVTLDRPSASAVYERGAVVTAAYSCADDDGGSGIKTCAGTVPNGEAIDTATLGSKSFTVNAEDNEGNKESVTHSYTVVDTTKPTVTLDRPADGATYERGSAVTAAYSCSDDSGIKACVGTVPDGAAIDTATLGSKTFTVEAEDNEGNKHSVTHSYAVVDSRAPAIDIASPRDGATFKLNEAVVVDYSCSDEGSGLASCVGDLPDGAALDTSRAGLHTFTVRSTDNAGNAGSRTVSYRVGGFEFEGFYGLKRFPALNHWKAGRVVPIMFSLEGYQGHSPIASGYPRSGPIACGSSEQLEAVETTRSRGHGRLRYKPKRDLYLYLWDTNKHWAGSCRQFVLKLDDGTVHRANFRFAAKKRPDHDDDD